MSVGAKISHFMVVRNMKQAELARLTGIEPSHISRIMNEITRKPNIITLKKIADALKVDIAEIISDERGYEKLHNYLASSHQSHESGVGGYKSEMPDGLRDLINDRRMARLISFTQEEIDWLKSIPFKPEVQPRKRDYIDMLSIYRNIGKEE